MNDAAGALLGLVLIGIWIGLIVIGVKTANDKCRSPHWMWFGIHPAGAIVMLIVMASLGHLKVCPNCGQKAKSFARICPHCGNAFTPKD